MSMKENKIRFAEMIKKIRTDHKMTQAEFGKKFGLDQQSVSKWERGRGFPEVATLIKIAEFADISVDELIFATGFTKGELLLKEKIEKKIPVEDLLNDPNFTLTRNGKPLTGAELSLMIATIDALRNQSSM